MTTPLHVVGLQAGVAQVPCAPPAMVRAVNAAVALPPNLLFDIKNASARQSALNATDFCSTQGFLAGARGAS
jgi:hypothetical protein